MFEPVFRYPGSKLGRGVYTPSEPRRYLRNYLANFRVSPAKVWAQTHPVRESRSIEWNTDLLSILLSRIYALTC